MRMIVASLIVIFLAVIGVDGSTTEYEPRAASMCSGYAPEPDHQCYQCPAGRRGKTVLFVPVARLELIVPILGILHAFPRRRALFDGDRCDNLLAMWRESSMLP